MADASKLPVSTEAAPVACDARGQVTEPAAGPGWAACGDAALAFDPVASQGLFNALAPAVEVAGLALADAPAAAEAAYRDRLAEIRRIYAARIAGVYARLAAAS
jgi:flavin-dependent dehydrogenase